MNQPDELPRWATDETNNDPPTSGQQDTGWEEAQTAVSSYFNWFMFLVYRWVLYFRSQVIPDFYMNQTWLAPMLASWTSSVLATGTNTVVRNPAANKPGVWLKQSCPANADRAVYYSPPVAQGPMGDTQAVFIEWLVDASELAGTPAAVYQAGLIHDEFVEPSTEDAVKFYKSSASANWRLVTIASGGSSTNVDTGVTLSGVQRMRLEIYGDDWPGGKRADAYINDILVATSTTNLPAGQAMDVLTFFKSTGLTNGDVYVSPMSARIFYTAPV